MGAQCCVNRKEGKTFSPQVLSFDPRKNGLAIAFVSLLEETCIGLKEKLDLLYEISQRYAYNHECCFLDPDYLQDKFSLIEFQSTGRKFQAGMGMANAFDKEIQYLLDEYLILDEDNYSVIILLMFGSSLHPFSLKKRTTVEGNCSYIVHDIFPAIKQQPSSPKKNSFEEDQSFKGVICKEIVFSSLQKLHQYLNTVSMYYYTQNPQQFTQKVQLLTFQVSDEKSFTCSESDLSFLHGQEFIESVEKDINRLSRGNINKSIKKSFGLPHKSSFGHKSGNKKSFGDKGKKLSEGYLNDQMNQQQQRSHAALLKEQKITTTMNSSTETESIQRTTQDTINSKAIA
ncbi:hypothetical protein TTHERM_00455180 (macronuclear) [Tetrahymena thermophila SB210]|uniref:Uncharacterized protein n=1 Tax=Tetrahymena thermophila (strain SB210) TaxID=312017 RepID=I7MA80_TETTS|nr:hypothetical protein TTHERM_00455180 [Tetrahymena thermophila SB210]EAS03879.1 hypothetical protein TTHERM_00455180 [Tetrahymena thermophila SB210]|eukprot:XP_001024124.1 hypothetical protein TTHERM_00455180 [Tetrahymena thermophila SB210]